MTNNSHNSNDAETELDRKAAEWFVRLRSSSITRDEKGEFLLWRAEDIRHRQAFEEYEAFWGSTAQLAVDKELQSSYKDILRRKRSMMTNFLSIKPSFALSFTVLIVAAIAFYRLPFDRSITYKTGVGEQLLVELKDETIIKLDTNTRVVVDYTTKERRIHLERGQIFLDVAKDKSRPLKVFFDSGSVTAVGTQFDVYKAKDSIRIAIIEGTIKIRYPAAPQNKGNKALTGNEGIGEAGMILSASSNPNIIRQVTYGARQNMRLESRQLSEVMGWQDQTLIFYDQPLESALDEINRYFDKKIIINDENLKEVNLSGVFRIRKQREMAQMIGEYFSLQVEEDGQGNLVLSRKTSK